MRKKVLMIAMTAAVALGLCACGKSNGGNELPSPETVATVAPTQGTQNEDSSGSKNETTETIPIPDYAEYVAVTKLPETYFGIEVKKVTDEEVEEYITQVLNENVTLAEVDRAVEEGDVVDVDFAGYLDGVAFDGGTGNNPELEIGSGAFIPGFEEGLIGMKKGESRSLSLTFPTEYRNADMAGKSVIFDVKINSVSVYEVPELDDAFAAMITNDQYKTTGEFRDYVRGLITDNREYDAVMEYMLEKTEFGTLNEDFVKANLQSMKDYYAMYAQMYGLDLETFMLYNGVPDAEGFWKNMEDEFRREEKERVILYCVAKAENITISEEEYKERVEELAESYDMTAEEFLEQQDQRYVEQSIYMESALKLLMDNVVTVE